MKLPYEEYAELIALTRLHLYGEYALREWKFTDPETFAYYKQFAKQSRPALSQSVAVEPAPKPATKPVEPPPPVQVVKKEPVAPPPKPKETVAASPPPETPPPVVHTQRGFELQPTSAAPQIDLSDIGQLVRERFPAQTIIEQVPSDEAARKIMNAWKQSGVIILSADVLPEHRTFLESVANAIRSRFMPAAIVSTSDYEKERACHDLVHSDNVKLILASAKVLQGLPHLMKHYQDDPQLGKRFLGKVPLCLLTSTAEYIKTPQLKTTLWNMIKQVLASHAV